MDHEIGSKDLVDINENCNNAIELKHIDPNREVYLIDILDHLHKLNYTCNYEFYLVLENSNKLFALKSPSNIVPIRRDHTIKMIWKDALTPPVVPLHQLFLFADQSRKLLV